MKYVLMFASRPESVQALDEARGKALYDEIFAWFEEQGRAGRIANPGAELQPVTTATTVRAESGRPVVVDGPFAETKEVLGGFTVIDVADLDAAIAVARTWPGLQLEGEAVEVRPIVDHG
jgi:hypothetical protein